MNKRIKKIRKCIKKKKYAPTFITIGLVDAYMKTLAEGMNQFSNSIPLTDIMISIIFCSISYILWLPICIFIDALLLLYNINLFFYKRLVSTGIYNRKMWFFYSMFDVEA